MGTTVNMNQTASKTFTWDMKCGWPNCGACAKCSSEDSSSTVHGKKQALLEETKFWPFTRSEETEPDTKKGEKDDKAEDKKATKAKANATKQDENTDTKKSEKEDKAEDTKATKAKANATKQDENTTKAVHGKKQALLGETKFWPFTSSEETEPDTKKGEKDDTTEDKKVTKAKANVTKQDENTDLEKVEKEDKAEDKKVTKAKANATKQDEHTDTK